LLNVLSIALDHDSAPGGGTMLPINRVAIA